MVRIGMAPGGATSVTYHATRSMNGTPDQRQTACTLDQGGGADTFPCFSVLIP